MKPSVCEEEENALLRSNDTTSSVLLFKGRHHSCDICASVTALDSSVNHAQYLLYKVQSLL